ncbi:MAG: hypothetical protein HKP32_06785, partial [Woeseia sp.]|nr:hypothetical protein [Woeseia sp.]
ARVVIAIGEPLAVPRSTPVAELEAVRARIEQATNELMVKAQATLES